MGKFIFNPRIDEKNSRINMEIEGKDVSLPLVFHNVVELVIFNHVSGESIITPTKIQKMIQIVRIKNEVVFGKVGNSNGFTMQDSGDEYPLKINTTFKNCIMFELSEGYLTIRLTTSYELPS